MKLMRHLVACTALLCLFSTFINAQIVGGRENGQSAPKETEAATLNAGGFSGDVSLFTGSFSSSYSLGTVSTMSGLSYTANLSYGSTMSSGDNLPHSSGIPYGEGWSVDLPTISITTDDYTKYNAQESADLGAGYSSGSWENFTKLFTLPEAKVEGRLYWFSPTLSIPGVVSGRLVYKYTTRTTPAYLINPNNAFVLHTFDNRYLEAFFDGNNWTVILEDGTRYEFSVKQFSTRNSANQRLITENAAAIPNLLLPKSEITTWYCSKIKHPNKSKEDITFLYDKYGKFNYYKEYEQLYLKNAVGVVGNNRYAFKDIFIREISSLTERLVFDHSSFLTEEAADLLDINDPAVTRFDSLYSSTEVYGRNRNFDHWNRYLHMKSDAANTEYAGPNFELSSTNPYLGYISQPNHVPEGGSDSPHQHYLRKEVASSGMVPFNHSFLESERIGADFIPGDIYEVKTKVNAPSFSFGQIDINLATGDHTKQVELPYVRAYSNEQSNSASNESYLLDKYYNLTRGESVFSTFNQGVKWNLNSTSTFGMPTSNYFVMPNLPNEYEGFHLQVGPGNSDQNFSESGLFYGSPGSLCLGGVYSGGGDCEAPDVYGTYFNRWEYNTSTLPLWHGNNVPSNFGIGYPWFMALDYYAQAESRLQNMINSSHAGLNNWWNSEQLETTNAYAWENKPTLFDEDVKLEKVSIIRHAKNPYMLKSVKKERLNGTLTYQSDYVSDWHAVSNLSFEYDVETINRSVSTKIDPIHSGPTPNPNTGKGLRNIFLLKNIIQLPLKNETQYAVNKLPTTFFEYETAHYDQHVWDVNNDWGLGTFTANTNFALLNKIITPLGKETNLEYGNPYILPQFENKKVYSNSEFDSHPIYGHDYRPIYRQADPYGYQTVFPVEQKIVMDGTSPRTWDYEYLEQKGFDKKVPLPLSISFNSTFSYNKGFAQTKVTEPALNESELRPYAIHYHKTDEENNLLWGKLYKSESFNGAGQLLSANETTYEVVKAFQSGNFRLNHVAPFLENDYHEYVDDYYFTLITQETGPQPPQSEDITDWQSYYSSYIYWINNISSSTRVGNIHKPQLPERAISNSITDILEPYVEALILWQGKYTIEGEYNVSSPTNIPSTAMDANFYEMEYAAFIQARNPTYLHSYFTKKTRETSTTKEATANGSFDEIQQITEYEYFDADHTGMTNSKGYEVLRPTAQSGQLEFEPSWQLYSQKTYSPQVPDAYTLNEYFYFYDLLNDPSYDIGLSYGPQGDYLHFDGLKKAFDYRLRNVGYQSRQSIKTPGNPVQAKSSYLLFDNDWNDIEIFDTEEYYDGVNCPEPFDNSQPEVAETAETGAGGVNEPGSDQTPPIFYPDDCHPPSQTNTWENPNPGYCPVYVGEEQMLCPCMAETSKQIMTQILDYYLMYRASHEQVDTSLKPSYSSNPVSSAYVANPILRFESHTDANGETNFTPVFPHETIETHRVLTRNTFGSVSTELDATGLMTKYEYNLLIREKHYGCDPYSSNGLSYITTYRAENLGMPVAITLGEGRADALTTHYSYNPDYSVNSITDPNVLVLSYDYDDFGRMKSAFQNGDKLSEVEYHQWENDQSLSFENRGQQNYVKAKTLNGDNSYVESQAFVDPLGRSLYAMTSTAGSSNTVVAGKTDYDAWGRASRSYKPYLAGASLPAFSEQVLENDLRSRPLKSAKFGLDIAGSKVVENQYNILTSTKLQLDLSLSSAELSRLLPGDQSAYRFLKTNTIDEDGKVMAEYANALGQKIASRRMNGGQKVVTLFLYDQSGKLTTVINPEKQESHYRYNFLGQLYEQETVDGGFTRNIYGINGQVVLQQDAEGEQGQYLRRHIQDAYARPRAQEQVMLGSASNPFANFTAAKSLAWSNPATDLNGSSAKKEKEWIYNQAFDKNDPTFHPNTLDYLLHSLSYTKGKPTLTKSYNLDGEPVEYRFLSYNPKGQLKWEMTQFNYNGISSDAKGLLVRMDYPEYNLQGSLLTQNIDLDGDQAQDYQYHYTYDAYNRLSTVYVSYNDSKTAGHKVAEYEYDEVLGLVTELNYFDANNTLSSYPVDQVTYAYDVRDRLTQLNSHLFEWHMYYDGNNPSSATGTSQNWNGNINATKGVYKTTNATNGPANFAKDIKYAYTYDGLNRLTNADASLSGLSGNTFKGDLEPVAHTEGDANYAYDKIGNLMSLNRWLKNAQGTVQQHSQGYVYGNGNNRLLTLNVSNNDIGSTSHHYTYDDNGNLLTDGKRSISETNYGRANLPWQVKVGAKDVGYLYDATDMRIYKNEINQQGSVTNAEYYLRSATGKELGVVDLNTGQLSWYIHGKERLAKMAHQLPWTAISSSSTFAKAADVEQGDQMTYSKYQSVQTMETTGSGDDTSIKLPDALHLVENSDGQRRYTLQSSINAGRETEAYTIIETIHLVSESQQLSMASKKGKPILISLKELKGMTGQEDPPILSSIDPFDNAMEQPQNPPIPEFIFYIYDHLGNTRVTYSTTHDGSAVVYMMEGAVDYFPYGKVLREYHNGEVEKYLSTQHERDQETGLDYRGARFYDADVGRFLSLDPLAAKYVELSDYSYVAGNPLTFLDPSGKFIIDSENDRDEELGKAKLLKKSIRKVRKYMKKLSSDSDEWRALLSHGEFRSKRAVMKHVFKNGRGPRIQFVNSEFGADPNEFTTYGFRMSNRNPNGTGFHPNAQLGNFGTNIGTYSGISIDNGAWRALNQSSDERHPNTVAGGGVSASENQAFNFFKSILLHETVHYGDQVTSDASINNHNPNRNTQPFPSTDFDSRGVPEYGDSFETAAYGRPASIANSGTFIQNVYNKILSPGN